MKKLSRKKAILLVLWLLAVAAFFVFWKQTGVSPKEVPEMLKNWLDDFGLMKAALIYIIIYTLRPIILFPATLLTVTSGILFGPWMGIGFTIIGENFSANLAFIIGRYLGRDWVKNNETDFIKNWDSKLTKNGIVTVMIMRFLYLPFDGVNYGCGLTSMKQRDFAIGTFLGILPGLTTFVLLGGTISAHASGMITILGLTISQRLFVFVLSVFFFIIGFVIAKYLKKYNGGNSLPTAS